MTQIWANSGSGNGLLPDGTKPLPEPMLTNQLQWHVSSSDIHLRVILWEKPQPLIPKISLKVTYLNFLNMPGADESIWSKCLHAVLIAVNIMSQKPLQFFCCVFHVLKPDMVFPQRMDCPPLGCMSWRTVIFAGPYFNVKTISTGIGILIINIRWPCDHYIIMISKLAFLFWKWQPSNQRAEFGNRGESHLHMLSSSPMRVRYVMCLLRVQGLIFVLHLSATMMWSNLSQYYLWHCNDSSRMWIRV